MRKQTHSIVAQVVTPGANKMATLVDKVEDNDAIDRETNPCATYALAFYLVATPHHHQAVLCYQAAGK